MKIINLSKVGSILTAAALIYTFTVGTYAAPVIRFAAGANPAAIQTVVDQFRADLGGSNNGIGGSFTTGRREVNWDGVPDNLSAPNFIPNDFFNVNSPRGVIFGSTSSFRGGNDQQIFQVSATAASGTAVRFGNIDASYSSIFQTFSAERLFTVGSASASDSNVLAITFVVPGTNIPATVSGFGAVFADVDSGSTRMHFYDNSGRLMPQPSSNVLGSNNGLSFMGVSYNAGERIAKVVIVLGTSPLKSGNIDGVNSVDVVAMDDFIYGEPRAATMHTADFDGDGTSDYSIFRPSTGAWFVLNSGSNTVTAVGFGQNGDIPVDGDFDGDQRTDVTVFRPSNGTWFRLNSSNGAFVVTPFGTNGDKPAPGDFDKDGKTDISVYRPSTGDYFSLKSSDGSFVATHWGATGDIPIGGAAQ